MILLRDLLSEDVTKPLTVYHGTGRRFRKFNLKRTTQGIIWFTSDRNKIVAGEAGADSSGYILTLEVSLKNPAGWGEYEKYGLGQLKSMGYDGVILDDDDGSFDGFVFSPNQVKIVNTEKTGDSIKEVEDYVGPHSAPDKESGSPLHDLSGTYPDDFYGPDAARYYGDMGGDSNDRISISMMQSFKGRPNKGAKVYRAVPSEITTQDKINSILQQKAHIMRRGKLPSDAHTNLSISGYYEYLNSELEKLSKLQPKSESRVRINPGDWVTLNPRYAKEHGEGQLRGKYRILSKTVPAKHLFSSGDSVHELGYDPS